MFAFAGDVNFTKRTATRLAQNPSTAFGVAAGALSKADLTIGVVPAPADEAHDLGVIEVDASNNVIGFEEKPKSTQLRSPFNLNMCSGSMGVYLFNTDVLLPALLKDAELFHRKISA